MSDSNVQRLFHDGKAAWKMVVEGANLFFTAEARTTLEEAGVHLFKDSSANKGGVTSSSLEVLASLALRPRDHDRFLTRQDDRSELPDFYKKYVQQIISRIEENCQGEFKAIWEACEQDEGMSKVDASKLVSKEINELTDNIASAELSEELIKDVLRVAIPELLVERFGVESLCENIPATYAKATVAYWLASKFVYENGVVGSNGFAFHKFMQRFQGQLTQRAAPLSPGSASPPDSPLLSPKQPLFLER